MGGTDRQPARGCGSDASVARPAHGYTCEPPPAGRHASLGCLRPWRRVWMRRTSANRPMFAIARALGGRLPRLPAGMAPTPPCCATIKVRQCGSHLDRRATPRCRSGKGDRRLCLSIGVQTGPLLGRDRRPIGTPFGRGDDGLAVTMPGGACRLAAEVWRSPAGGARPTRLFFSAAATEAVSSGF